MHQHYQGLQKFVSDLKHQSRILHNFLTTFLVNHHGSPFQTKELVIVVIAEHAEYSLFIFQISFMQILQFIQNWVQFWVDSPLFQQLMNLLSFFEPPIFDNMFVFFNRQYLEKLQNLSQSFILGDHPLVSLLQFDLIIPKPVLMKFEFVSRRTATIFDIFAKGHPMHMSLVHSINSIGIQKPPITLQTRVVKHYFLWGTIFRIFFLLFCFRRIRRLR